MIPKECKRLAEVDFPIAVVSKHSAREKSIRHGHPSTLHLWWARRPLAACRAMLLGLLLPDPGDPNCPKDFKNQARELLPRLLGTIGPKDEALHRALQARREPLITLGSAPLEVPEFRSVVLGQLGESKLVAAIDSDISGEQSHARALDADTKGALRNIHRRVATTILFESSGGQIDKVGPAE